MTACLNIFHSNL